MAKLKISGSGFKGMNYTVEIDGVVRPDVEKLTLYYDVADFVRAEMTVIVDELDVVGELGEVAQAEAAKRSQILFSPRSRP